MDTYFITDKGKAYFKEGLDSGRYSRGSYSNYQDYIILGTLEGLNGSATFEEMKDFTWGKFTDSQVFSDPAARTTLRRLYEAGLIDRMER